MIPASGAYRNITGAQHAIHGAKPGEYSSNPQAASKFVDHLYNTIEDVCSFPENGTIIDDTYISNEKVRMKIDQYNE